MSAWHANMEILPRFIKGKYSKRHTLVQSILISLYTQIGTSAQETLISLDWSGIACIDVLAWQHTMVNTKLESLERFTHVPCNNIWSFCHLECSLKYTFNIRLLVSPR